jgi:PPP family 3-phenylpropionic acid transporter
VRFALFYGAFYLGFGAYLPYMPVWFEGRGLSPEMIGLAAGAAMAGRVIAAPLGAAFADRTARRRDAVTVFALAAALLFLAHVPATNPWLIVALAGLAGGAYTGVIPVIDSFAVREAGRRRFAFGPPRAFGSATFILGNVACGALIGWLGDEAALYWTLVGAALAVLAAMLLPEGKRSAPAPKRVGRRRDQRPRPGAQVQRLAVGFCDLGAGSGSARLLLRVFRCGLACGRCAGLGGGAVMGDRRSG